MRCLVTGATGFLGKALCAEMSRQGYSLRVAVRVYNNGLDDVEQSVVGVIDNDTDWSTALFNLDTIIHLAARVHVMNDTSIDPLAEFRKVNVEGTLNLVRQAAEAGVKRFIYISTIGVNGAQSKIPFTESDAPHPHSSYALSKLEAELGLQEICLKTGMEFVIIRPPLVYGADAPGNFARLIEFVKRQTYLPLGAVNNKRSFVYVGNLVSLILKCIQHPAARDQTFLVSDGQDISTTQLLRACASEMGVKSKLLPVPQKLLEIGAAFLGKRNVAQQLCGDLQVDITKARELLDWIPPYSFDDGLKATVSGVMDK